MNVRESKLVVVEGCGSESLDTVLATVNLELSGDGVILTHTDDLNNTTDDSGRVLRIINIIQFGYPNYEGLVLLRK
mgnify:CR=1 FL=1